MNMLDTIHPKSDQLNADDLIGRTLTIKVTKVELLGGEQPVAVSFEGDNGKPYLPGKSMRRVMVSVWGPDANKYIGQAMTLYRDEKVQFGGLAVGGIRISHMTGIEDDRTLVLTATRGNKRPHVVRPLRVAKPTPKRTFGDFLAEVKVKLDACVTEEDVQTVVGSEDVKKALTLKGDGTIKLNAIIKDALDRVAAPIEEEMFDVDPDADFDAASAS